MPNSPMLLRLSAETPEAGPTLHPAVVEQASSHILFSPHGLHCPVLCSEVLYYFISLIPKQKCYLKSCILNWTSQKVALDLFLEAVVLKLQGAVRRDVESQVNMDPVPRDPHIHRYDVVHICGRFVNLPFEICGSILKKNS